MTLDSDWNPMRVGKQINAKYPHEMRWFVVMLAWPLPLHTYDQTDGVNTRSRALRAIVTSAIISVRRTYASR